MYSESGKLWDVDEENRGRTERSQFVDERKFGERRVCSQLSQRLNQFYAKDA